MRGGGGRKSWHSSGPDRDTPERRAIKVSTSTISGGDYAPQHRNGLPELLASLDQPALEAYMAVPVPLDGGGAALPPGPAAAPAYNLEALRLLVDELWPPRPPRSGIRGRPPVHRLPVVCALLRVCDPSSGVVYNLLAEHDRLKSDEDYRRQSGFLNRLPSRSVFTKTHDVMVEYWSRFRDCQIRLPGPADGNGSGQASFGEQLQLLDWNGNLPPLLDLNGSRRFPAVSQRTNGASASVPGPGPCSRGSVGYWPSYNDARVHEAGDVMALLGGLGDIVNLLECENLPPRGRGRPRTPL